MAINLQIEHLTKSFGERVLFEDLCLTIEQGQRVGLIAANGTGKTTLLRILMGVEDYQGGQVVRRRDLSVGYLEQDPSFGAGVTVGEACFHGDSEVARVVARYEGAVQLEDHVLMQELSGLMDSLGGWDYEQRSRVVLTQLKITDLSQMVSELSGGQLKRVALANALICEPDLLILDEPTNHLDIEMTEWLQEWLAGRNISLVMVTHDRYFLDSVCNVIVEIDNQQLYTYKGNYSYFLEKRQQRVETADAEALKTRNLYKRELEWIRRTPSARTGKSKSRTDAFEDIAGQRRTVSRERSVELGIKASYIGTKIFEVSDLCKRYGDKVLLDRFSYKFARYEKMGIVGNNGTGKSTFIKMLMGMVAPDSGVVDVGETVKFGYYGQTGLEFDDSMKVIDVVKAISEDILMADGSRLTASQFLQQFLFDPKTQHNFVSRLSGGERRRLYLCTILIGNPNFLILDEPTNDLDIQTLNVLEDYLAGYGGCLIVVSHDRYFMDKVVDHLLVFQGDGVVKDFPGGYSDYRAAVAAAGLSTATAGSNSASTSNAAASSNSSSAVKSEKPKKMSFNQKREFESIEVELPELEARRADIERQMSSGTLSSEQLMEMAKQVEGLIAEIDEKTMRWLILSEL